jgi:hypothetical protein
MTRSEFYSLRKLKINFEPNQVAQPQAKATDEQRNIYFSALNAAVGRSQTNLMNEAMTSNLLRSTGISGGFSHFKLLTVAFLSFALTAIWNSSTAQNTGVGISDNVNFTPNPKAILDLGPSTPPKGFMVPRMTQVQRNALCTGTPDPDCVNAPGLMVYQTDGTPGYYLWTGSTWTRLLDQSSAGWAITGNSGTTAGTNFLGTTDGQDLRIRTGNLDAFTITNTGKRLLAFQSGTATAPVISWSGDDNTGIYRPADDVLSIATAGSQRLRISPTGNVGIGVATDATERLHLDGNILFTNDASKSIYVGSISSANTSATRRSLTVKAGDGGGGGTTLYYGGHLVLQAGHGNYNSGAAASPVGGHVLIRAGANSGTSVDGNFRGDIKMQVTQATSVGADGDYVTAMIVRSNGRVGIGNETPAHTLDVTGDVNLSGRIRINGNGGTANQVLRVNDTNTGLEWGPTAPATSLSIAGQQNGDMLYFNGTNWVRLPVPGSSAGPSGVYWALTLPNSGVGAPAWEETTAFTTTGDDMGDHVATMNIDLNGYNLSGTGNININGRVLSIGIQETSDARFKKNVSGINAALDLVNQLRGVTYDWRTDEFPERGFSQLREMGVIAQEVEALVPEVVHTDEEGFKSVQYGHLVPLLIEAIKEQQTIIDGQKAEISAMKGMKNELDVLKASVELLSEHIKTSQK